MRTVRAKMRVTSVTTHEWSPHARGVKLTAEYDTTIPEEQRYAQATPSGSVDLVIDNPAIVDFFTLGRKFYIDFVEAG